MIRIFSYSRSSTRMETPGISDLTRHLADTDRVIWVDLEDPDDEEMGVLGGIFGFHVLAAEDCIQGGYLPMINIYDTYAFFVLHAVDFAQIEDQFQTIEVGFFLGERFLVTHHAKQVKGIFDSRGKVAQNPGTLLNAPDLLLHNIVDAMTDHYTPAIRALINRIERVAQSAEVIETLGIEVARLQQMGKLQEAVLTRLAQNNLPFISDPFRIYFKNVETHMIRAVQFSESCAFTLTARQHARLLDATQQQLKLERTLTVLGTTLATAICLTLLLDPKISDIISISDSAWSIGALAFITVVSLGVAGLFKLKKWF